MGCMMDSCLKVMVIYCYNLNTEKNTSQIITVVIFSNACELLLLFPIEYKYIQVNFVLKYFIIERLLINY
jgi:hypothetical protein